MVILEFYQDTDASKFDIVRPLISLAPLLLLICDWLVNRIYFPITVNFGYCIYAYSFTLLFLILKEDIENIYPLPELVYFTKEKTPDLSHTTKWFLPLYIMISVYVANRIKFWYLSEGDMMFDFDEWARQAQSRMDYIESDGAREEENFYFNVAKDDQQSPYIDYTDPREVEKQMAARDNVNKYKGQSSLKHKRLGKELARSQWAHGKKLDRANSKQDGWFSSSKT